MQDKKHLTFTMPNKKVLNGGGDVEAPKLMRKQSSVYSRSFSMDIKRQVSGGTGQWCIKESLKEESEIEGKSTTFMASFNLLQVTVGAGILGLPRAFLRLGGVLGFAFLFLCCLLNIWAMKTVIRWKEKTGLKTYEEITEHALGAFGYWLPNITVWILLFFVTPLLMDIVAEFLFPLLHYIGYPEWATMNSLFTRLFLIGLSVVLYPLLLFKDLSMLSWSSMFGFSCIFVLLILTTIVVGILSGEGTSAPSWNSLPYTNTSVFEGMGCIGSILCSYLSIFSIADIHESLKNKKDMTKVIYIGNLLPLLAYFWMAIIVYIFLHKFELEALQNGIGGFYTSHFKNIDIKTLIICVGSCFEAVAISLRIPLFHFLWRKRTFDMMTNLRPSQFNSDSEAMPTWFFYGHTIFWFLALVCAIFASNVLGYIAFLGSFIGGMMMLFFPSLLAMRENGGIKHNLSFTLCERDEDIAEFDDPDFEITTSCGEQNSSTSKILNMVFLNFIFYAGICFILNSFYILATSFS